MTTGFLRRLTHPILLSAWCLALMAVAATPLAAQTPIPVTGQVLDATGDPVEGFRVVFREVDGDGFFVSNPSDAAGEFRVHAPRGINCSPVAVFSPLGKRLELEGAPRTVSGRAMRWDVQLGIDYRPPRDPRPFKDADRLFVSFVEDAVFVERQHTEADLITADYSNRTSVVSQYLAAFNVRSLPTMEFGGRLGLAGTDWDGSKPSAAGLTDLQAWVKFHVGASLRSGARYAAGGLVTFPTGDVDTGLSTDAAQAKVFGAARVDVGPVTLAANIGIGASNDVMIDGRKIDGQFAGSVGIAALSSAVGRNLVLTGELTFEGARLDGADDDGRVTFGANWAPLGAGFFRLALGFGLTDGAPDGLLRIGYAFAF